jgi:hypothetical protein
MERIIIAESHSTVNTAVGLQDSGGRGANYLCTVDETSRFQALIELCTNPSRFYLEENFSFFIYVGLVEFENFAQDNHFTFHTDNFGKSICHYHHINLL